MAWKLNPDYHDPDMHQEFGKSYQEMVLERYDFIDFWKNSFNWDDAWDEVLYVRSALEFIREQLPCSAIERLDAADAYWRAHPHAFNQMAKYHHARKDVKNELYGYIADENGNWPNIPKSHWWWWPLDEKTA